MQIGNQKAPWQVGHAATKKAVEYGGGTFIHGIKRFLASEGIPEVLELVKNVKARFNPHLEIVGILLTMYQSRPQLCKSIRESVADVYGEAIHIFERPIEASIKAAECPAAGVNRASTSGLSFSQFHTRMTLKSS